MPEVTTAASRWRKSSYSGNDANCVEVRTGPAVGVRDSKHTSAILTFSQDSWTTFIAEVSRPD